MRKSRAIFWSHSLQGLPSSGSWVREQTNANMSKLNNHLAGYLSQHIADVRLIIWSGYLAQVAGYGSAALLFTPQISLWYQEAIVTVIAAGIGLALSPTMLVIQASVPSADMAAATSGWVLVRSTGPSIGQYERSRVQPALIVQVWRHSVLYCILRRV